MTEAKTEEEFVAPKVSTAGWKRAATHDVVCPSGVTVTIRVPDIPALIEAGTIPQHLLDTAIGVATGDTKPNVEMLKQQREYTDLVTMAAVVEPKLTEADLADIPFEDKDFIVAIATRQRDLDALGNHIAGLEKSEKWRRFRELFEFRPNVEDL